ncbi:putative Dehydrogenase [Taphrina deformans PYCC 5710]|uniref:Dehydrogenase n=1 Tax=Taphrina deformans (strain PYCC 5710 / ATCC 11124 / CBS 356.35 / IMI 108563 / JCM 9778 / NBRC 8474) TaxID=1097556 RepID=R4XAU0_TAPDE|nr:putative Dehydrogenase [Taphrina deformans PYCC 5710]|eukprot:CCG81438.1 putative Dehydrogenase [Taphrina deformans PYCC 5710]
MTEQFGEHLLVSFKVEDHLLDRLRSDSRFASVEYYPSNYVEGTKHPGAFWHHEPPEVPKKVLEKTTIQMTMFYVPAEAESVPNLRFIQGMSAGVEHLLPALAPLMKSHPDLKIASASGVHATTIAEYCIMNLLSLFHRQSVLRDIQAQQKWNRTMYIPPGQLGGCSELRGKRLGVLGYGCIGREVARLASAFGMSVAASTSGGTRTLAKGYTIQGTGDPDGALPVSWSKSTDGAQFEQFLRDCDVLVISCPSTPATKHLINRKTLGYLSSDVVLVNVARGSVIDHDALLDALEGDKLAGAVLDVTDPEPLPPNHPLWQARNCVVTPHIAGGGHLYTTRCVDLLSINVDRLSRGEAAMNAVDAQKGY